MFDYNVSNTVLSRTLITKDLGGISNKELTFAHHITSKLNDAMRAYDFIKRHCGSFTNIKVLVILYSAFSRSMLKYGWSFSLRVDSVYPERAVAYCDLLIMRRKRSSTPFFGNS